MMKKVFTCLVAILLSTVSFGAVRPFNLSLTPDVAIHDRGDTIEGLTLSVWGENHQRSLALGLVNGSVGQSAGLSIGLVLNYAESYKGLQWAVVNYVKGDFLGWQDGLVNYAAGEMKGLQSGVVNYAGRLTGLQLGLLNYAHDAAAGVQIGLVNIIRQNQSWFTELPDELAPGMVFINWRF